MDRSRLFAVAAALAALPGIHAHRGGSVLDGVPRFPENTMPAFENAARAGWVLELDAKLTQDGVPVVMHDPTLDRTTSSGEVRDYARAALAACKADMLGSPGSELPSKPAASPVAVPTLADALAL